MTVSVPRQARRTQQQRREHTIGRLVEAACDALVEVGYAHSSVQEICTRAGVSQGALFRHFPNRRALLVATAEHVAREQVAQFRERFSARELDLYDVLVAVRSQVRSRNNQVWLELVQAARTDPKLSAALSPALRSYNRAVSVAATALAGHRFGDPAVLAAVLRITLGYLDGETRFSVVDPDPQREDEALDLLARLLTVLSDCPSITPGPRTETRPVEV